VSASTVRNRIDGLESDGIIKGYHPQINYEAAGLPLEMLFIISASPTEREKAVDDLMGIKGVVDVRETLAGKRNIFVEAVGTSKSDITRLTDSIHDLGLEIETSEMIKQRRVQPFNHFYYEGQLIGEQADNGDQ